MQKRSQRVKTGVLRGDKWRRYETEKARIDAKNLSARERDKEIQRLLRWLGL